MEISLSRILLLLAAIFVALMAYVGGVEGAFGGTIVIMTGGFLFGVPFALGFVTAWAIRPASRLASAAVAVGPLMAILALLWLADWEGTICIVLSLPLSAPGACLGGAAAFDRWRRAPRTELAAVFALPFLLMTLEGRVVPRERVSETASEIRIGATATRVWDEIAEVDTIRADERGTALYTVIGFPAPIAATLDLPQEGGVRIATFDRGVRFVETITEWEPEQRLAFSIDPVEDAEGLDTHVRIGGPVFDVLEGTYEVTSLGTDSVRLTLRSRHRVSTRLNLYAGWWADLVMASVQRSILDVIATRAEDPTRGAKGRIRAATEARQLRHGRSPLAADSRGTGFSITAGLLGSVDRYADSVVVLVRDGQLAARAENRPQRLDSITASLASSSGGSWNPGTPSPALVLEWPVEDSVTRALGPMRRFTIPLRRGEALDGRWVVFTHHLTVPKTDTNPSGIAWTYTHDVKPTLRTP